MTEDGLQRGNTGMLSAPGSYLLKVQTISTGEKNVKHLKWSFVFHRLFPLMKMPILYMFFDFEISKLDV